MDIYAAFRDMVDSLLEMHLEDMGVTGEQFAAVCEAAAQQQVGMEVLEQILAVDDFVSFKKMMVKRNMELELEAMKAVQSLSTRIAAEGSGGGGEQEEPGEDDFEAQLQLALELSMKEAQAAGTSTDINSSDVDRPFFSERPWYPATAKKQFCSTSKARRTASCVKVSDHSALVVFRANRSTSPNSHKRTSAALWNSSSTYRYL